MTNTPLPDPELKPDLPPEAEKLRIFDHIRYQFHPIFLNEIGAPDIHGPKEYIGLDLRCPVCKHIQHLGHPGIDHKCTKCGINYKYTAAKGNSWLYIWKDRPKLNLDEVPNAS